MNEVVLRPSAEQVRKACMEFDSDNEVIEEALGDLFRQYQGNAQRAHVLLKVTALNALYSTQIPLYSARIPTVFEVADHIAGLEIDSELRGGDVGAVYRIARIEPAPKSVRYNYSFATKYCSWHNPRAYPIWDSRANEYLCHLRKQKCLKLFKQVDVWKYSIFKKIVEDFRESNALGEFSFKEIDKFLYLQGSLLARQRESKERRTGANPVPVPETFAI